MGEAILTYVYCVADAKKLRLPKRPPAGLPHAGKPHAVELGGDLALIVCDVPADEYAADKIDARLKDLTWVSNCALAHERIVEHFASKTTVIPMKLFTLFSTEERAQKDVGKKRRLLERTMKRLDGREEWGVRVAFDEIRALKTASKTSNGDARVSSARSGRSFLERKKGERDVKKHVQTQSAAEATKVFEELALLAEDARRRPTPAAIAGPRVILDAAFLIKKRAVKKLKVAVEEHAQRLAELGYDVTMTGPWPPYNFVEGA
jgi:hypothetical protein